MQGRSIAGVVLFVASTFAHAIESPIHLPQSWAALELDSVPQAREPLPDRSADIEARKSYGIPAAQIVIFDTLLNQWDRHHEPCCDYNSSLRTIRRNLRSSWVVD